ncbi:MAG: hypothetical protein KGJ41_00590 [Rhodospirillales bacterium]|nr:hypothetical protein [Rhodospirillales bacterium]
MGAKRRKGDRGGVVIRKEEIIEGGHHGGAWKVAYADFVTAMMAFFLLMWLLNATTEAQRKGLADYFTPSNALSHTSSGSGQPFGGHTPYDSGNMVSDRGTAAITPAPSRRRPTIRRPTCRPTTRPPPTGPPIWPTSRPRHSATPPQARTRRAPERPAAGRPPPRRRAPDRAGSSPMPAPPPSLPRHRTPRRWPRRR